MDKKQLIEKIGENWLCMIIRADTVEDTEAVCDALYDGGARLIEVAFTTPNVCEVIGYLKNKYGDEVTLSAGTVRKLDWAKEAVAAGADCIVAPGFDPEIVKYTVSQGKVSMPGCVTPTEIEAALAAGADIIKLFPAYPFGPEYVSYIHGPMPEARMAPAGKLTLDNMRDWYLGGAFCGVAGVTTEMKMDIAVKEKRWGDITKAAAHWLQLVADLKKL